MKLVFLLARSPSQQLENSLSRFSSQIQAHLCKFDIPLEFLEINVCYSNIATVWALTSTNMYSLFKFVLEISLCCNQKRITGKHSNKNNKI